MVREVRVLWCDLKGQRGGSVVKGAGVLCSAGVSIPLAVSGDGRAVGRGPGDCGLPQTTQWFQESTWKTQSPQRRGDENKCVIEEKPLGLATVLFRLLSFRVWFQ